MSALFVVLHLSDVYQILTLLTIVVMLLAAVNKSLYELKTSHDIHPDQSYPS